MISCDQKKVNKTGTSTNQQDSSTVQVSNDTVKQVDVPADSSSTDQRILNIRSEYARINSLELTEKRSGFVCDTDGTVTFYTHNGKVVKVLIDWGFVGHGSTKTEYYFKAGKLIFIYETYVGGPVDGPDTKTEYRTYVENDRTIKYMENQQVKACNKCSFNKTSRPYKVLAAYGTQNIKSALCN